jgi:hypothetical protein
MFAACPAVWVSKLQTEVALIRTEEEYFALSQAIRGRIPLLRILDELALVLHLNKDQPLFTERLVALNQINRKFWPVFMKIIQVLMRLLKLQK